MACTSLSIPASAIRSCEINTPGLSEKYNRKAGFSQIIDEKAIFLVINFFKNLAMLLAEDV